MLAHDRMKKNIIIVLVLSLWFMSAYWLGSYYRRAQVVGVAVQKYVDVLDAESTDPQCTLEHCPNSSKSLPGMPADRGLFTENERFIVENKGFRGPASSTRFSVKHTKKQSDGTVEAIVGTTVTKCYSSGLFEESYGSSSDIHQIILAPSTIKGEYVVIADKLFGETENPISPYASTLYKGNRKADPPCSVGSR